MPENFEEADNNQPRNRHISHLSKFLSLILRHRPELIGATLNEQGWTDLSLAEIVNSMTQNENKNFSWVKISDIEEVVNTDPKGRYEISENDPRVLRATYGHSVEVEGLLDNPSGPEDLPQVAYFGCSNSEMEGILKLGIETSERQYIHLSVRKNDALAIARKKFRNQPRIVSINLEGVVETGIRCKAITPLVIIIEEIPSQFISEISVPERYRHGPRRNYQSRHQYRSSGLPSTFNPRNQSDNRKPIREKSKSVPIQATKPKKESFDDFDNDVEFVFKKKKEISYDNDEITDKDFDFEM
ncbi:MAG: putative RNA 2'-phosphotransferase [Candidatus Heimdallarchaeota archaeon LC_3]|nr:MAG: putative RNA 2'-phosphotransferase [Candidatus Heimdallarchaeota archaeon LC_3]